MAQSVTVLHNFGGFSGDGVLPNGVCLGGNALYGTTEQGGDNGVGTVFSVGTNGSTYSVLHSFAYFNSTLPNPTNSEGGYPQAGVVLFSNTLFGTTSRAGSNSCGTVYCLETNGANFRVLHTFAGTSDGAHPDTSLIVSGNVLYGAAGGGASNTGTIFSLNADGTGFKVLYSFSLAPFNFALGLNTNSDGAFPHALVLAGGVLYGLTEDGGPYGDGTTFALGTNGAGFTVLRTSGGLRELIVSGSTIYGDSYATVFAFNTNGTGFTNFFSVPNGFNGLGGGGALTLAGDLFYGTVFTNGGYGSGSVFSLGTNGGGFSVLHTFPRRQRR